MLLLIFSNSYGVLMWSGPHASRTVTVEPESRRLVVL